MLATRPKLAVGDVITVHGWIMLAKLDAGKYRVASITDHYGKPAYSFARPKGSKVIVRHYCDSVDLWIASDDCIDLNKITR